ncbi:MAG TPA: phosphotransferase [Anaerolineales bacterium]
MYSNSPIALGFTAQIYAWKDGQVLKLFNQGISRGNVETEAELTRIAGVAGLPVPAVGDIVEVEGRYGLEYERIDGISILEALAKQPWMFAMFAHQLAGLQADMHKVQVPEMPSQHKRLQAKINRARLLSQNLRQAALKALDQLPHDDKLCHGDFHPGNILLAGRGPVIIDWLDASKGHPLMDIASSTLLFGGGPISPGTPGAPMIRLLRQWFYRSYLRRYGEFCPFDRKQLSKWIPVAAAARLDENITRDENRLLSIAQTLLRFGYCDVVQ